MKLIHISLKCETIVYSWRLIKFIYTTVFYTNFNKEEMLQKHVEIYWKCLVKVQFLIGHAEDGTKNLKQVISTFLISHVLDDHFWSTTMLLRQCWSKILFWQHRRSQKFSSTNHFWPYSEDRIGVKVFKMGATWIKSEKFGWSSCHMHISACSEQNRALFEPNDNWG